MLAFLLFVFLFQTGAQFDAVKLPQTVVAVREFVPAGWTVEAEVGGDLNRDSIADLAVVLVEEMPANADKENPPERQRALLILFKTADGKFKRAALAEKVLLCTRCGGAFYGMAETSTHVEIKNGVLIVWQDYGSREITKETYRFRHDPDLNRFVFIGVDLESYDRANGQTLKESTNFLTGVKLTTKGQMAENSDKETTVSKKSQRVSRSKKFLEDIAARYNEQEEK
ncbi:MAG: hypothetical protein SF097_26300 [Acidobacteriota bacterium]|nr:hypothetical protein [Acidobacteriota bacterium]